MCRLVDEIAVKDKRESEKERGGGIDREMERETKREKETGIEREESG